MSKKKIALIGASGRMGRSIIQVLAESEECQLSSAVCRPNSVYSGLDSGLHSGLNQNHILFTSDLEASIKDCDAVIDFSSAEILTEVVQFCLQYKKPLVVGTTGLEESARSELQKAAEKIAVVQSPNMSVGINLLWKLSEMVAKVYGDSADIEIQDIHHRHKKDAPSGTAVKLKETLLRALGRSEENVIYGRHGISGERDPKEIAVHTLRAGEVIGEHTAYFFTPEERIELTHKAQDRKVFAVGSVRAAIFVLDKKTGFFDMFDVLGI